MKIRKAPVVVSLIASAIAVTGAWFAPHSDATPAVPKIAPGVSITTNGGPLGGGTWCTLTALGHDSTGRLLGLAAGHCIPPNHNLDVKAANGYVIGHWVTAPTGFPGIYDGTAPQDLSHDGAFFEVAPGVPVTSRMITGKSLTGIGTDPVVGQHMCKYGQVTQETCGTVSATGSPFTSNAIVIPGDSGGPAYSDDGKLIGITSALFPSRFSSIQNILADAAPQGVTGFTVLP